ncbi:MAG: imidazole glycerol phosphate synthase subunit HisF [Candidatus Omnitrophica bacterium]|nr:imidazole glycerol phosphate synthase subunit HisF [Candidatus Omnitrophota bacterium]
MKKKRLIPVLLLKNGFLVQSKSFKRYQNLGNPVTSVKRLSEWAADELIYIDISREDVYDMRRDDLGHYNRDNILDIIDDVSRDCHMPVTIGGRIRSLRDMAFRLSKGADKVSINTKALEDPGFIEEAAKEFGSQCVIVSMDAKSVDGAHRIMSDGGRQMTGYSPAEWATIAEEKGAGEILINSIDRDGRKNGYDIDLVSQVVDAVDIPVIALGGVGEWEHFSEVLEKTDVDAVAAANIFHYSDQSVYLAKKYLYEKGHLVRQPDLLLEEVNSRR